MTVVGAGLGYSPPPNTAASLIRAVLDYCQVVNDPDQNDVAMREINLAIDEINTRHWRKLVGIQQMTCVTGQIVYQLNLDFKDPYMAQLLDQNEMEVGQLGFQQWQTFVRDVTDFTSGNSPCLYSVDYSNNVLRLDSAPSQEWVTAYPWIRVRYYRRLGYVTHPSAVHGGVPEFNAFIIWRARAGYAAVRGQGIDHERAEVKAERMLSALRRSDNETQTDWM